MSQTTPIPSSLHNPFGGRGTMGYFTTHRHAFVTFCPFTTQETHTHIVHTTHWHFGNFQYTMDLKILFHQLPKQPPLCCMQRETRRARGGRRRRMNRQFTQSWLHMSNPFMVLMRLMVRLCRRLSSVGLVGHVVVGVWQSRAWTQIDGCTLSGWCRRQW